MEKRDARLFQLTAATLPTWNIVELESHRQLRQRIQEIIDITQESTLSTSEIRALLLQGMANYGNRFAMQLVRSLNRKDYQERQTIVWLLTIFNHPVTIPPLQRMASNKSYPRLIRLSASLTLAGLGATVEYPHSENENQPDQRYAIC